MDVDEKKRFENIVAAKQDFFSSGRTKDLSFRKEQLGKFSVIFEKHEKEIFEALKKDLGRCQSETYLAELLSTKSELALLCKKITSWSAKRKVTTPMLHWPASSYIQPEPYGVVLIISPWNYPFSLSLIPAMAAVAAGNTVVLKPSEYSAATTSLLVKLIGDYFDSSLIEVVDGGVDETKLLLESKFDYIFYTGGPAAAHSVMAAAAKNLTPLTLELGGKSPCILHNVSNLQSAVKRIIWGKFFNAGQTCVAPDYLLLRFSEKKLVLSMIYETIKDFYTASPKDSRSYSRIINLRHLKRLSSLLQDGNILLGGDFDEESLYFSPTVLDGITWDSPIMQEEVFGPLLPVICYENISEVINELKSRPKPLALYLFTDNDDVKNQVIGSVSSGGVCVNDTVLHLSNPFLPFGGVGNSGMGAYHGKAGFDTFSHLKSVMERKLGFDVDFRFPPYENMPSLLKKLLAFIG